MLRGFLKDESGMTMGLTVIMIVLVGVMGAGLLTFVRTDLESVVNENQGERAFELAGAGIHAAKMQIGTSGGGNPESYNGGATADLKWSKCFGLPITSAPPCVPSAGAGFTLTDLDGSASTTDSAHVTIEYTGLVSGQETFIAVSTGAYGDARRKIEAVFKKAGVVTSVPPAWFTRDRFEISGNVTSQNLDYFAMEDARVDGGSFDLGTSPSLMKAWAATADPATSYPNDFNSTARKSTLPGIFALEDLDVGSNGTQVAKGTRSFDLATTPQTAVKWSAGKIAFPFETGRLPNDLEILRRRAQELEASNPSVNYYNDSPTQTTRITTLPDNTDHTTVFFYKFPFYDTNNTVTWDIPLPCTDESKKAVLVVENGNFVMTGNRGGFNGTILVYGGTDPTTGQPYNRGQFTGTGGACMNGFVTSTGRMTLAGNFKPNAAPINTLPIFAGGARLVSWRELYQ